MREPMQWTLPVGRLFEVGVRVHILLPIVFLGVGLKQWKALGDTPGAATAILAVAGLTFFSILLHEFGHVFAARAVGGDCDEVVLWPLGGLAMCDLPHSPRAHLITAVAGPFVNLGLCILTAAFLAGQMVVPPANLFETNPFFPPLYNWSLEKNVDAWYILLAGRLFWINWALFFFNLLPAFPMDFGRVLHALLWARSDETSAAGSTAYIGFGVMLVMCVVAIYFDSVLLLGLTAFIYVNCRALVVRAETGVDEVGGFDPSSDPDEPSPTRVRKPRPGWLQRWRQERAARIAHQEQEDRQREENRLDELLEKVQRLGKQSLTAEEERFLTRVSTRYRNNKS
ncbi:MAG: site-2 protease family protein [Gemmataceae bacterium]|nr:site-2 protease family protein [Gemmataceae bacterium]